MVAERGPVCEVINAFSVDVEEYFQVYALSGKISPDQWCSFDSRLARGVDGVLSLLADHGVKGTFFILGWVARQVPQVVKAIAAGGHEIASHGMNHQRVDGMTPAQFLDDVIQSKELLEDLTGCGVRGYRAPNFSIGGDSLWALRVLAEAGYGYSSSIYPINHDHYGMPATPLLPWYPQVDGVLEIPVAALAWRRWRIPAGGGGYFRFYPYGVSRWLLRRLNRRQGSGVFFIHPWELDWEQPVVAGLPWRSRFRHYLNLSRTAGRLDRLLGDFAWAPIGEVFAHRLGRP